MPPILKAQSQQNLVKTSQDATQEGNQTATTKTSLSDSPSSMTKTL